MQSSSASIQQAFAEFSYLLYVRYYAGYKNSRSLKEHSNLQYKSAFNIQEQTVNKLLQYRRRDVWTRQWVS